MEKTKEDTAGWSVDDLCLDEALAILEAFTHNGAGVTFEDYKKAKNVVIHYAQVAVSRLRNGPTPPHR